MKGGRGERVKFTSGKQCGGGGGAPEKETDPKRHGAVLV